MENEEVATIFLLTQNQPSSQEGFKKLFWKAYAHYESLYLPASAKRSFLLSDNSWSSVHRSFLAQRLCQCLWIFVWDFGEGIWRGWKAGPALASSPATWMGRLWWPGQTQSPNTCPLRPASFPTMCVSRLAPNSSPSLSLPFHRPLGLPAGLTLITLPSDRAARIRLPAGLATCRWSTLRWGWTPSSLKTRSLFCGRNTETSSGFEGPGRVREGPREGLEDRVSCLSAASRSAQQRSQIVPSIQIN